MIKTTKEKLKDSIYEALNNLDYSLSNKEIEEVQNKILKSLN